MKNISIYITFLFLLFSKIGLSQQPSYSIIGEDFFSGMHIYDIIQDRENNYWIATNNGIYKYNGISFSEIPIPTSHGGSFFNLNQYGEEIFCNNLNGQFFKIVDDKSELYFQLPDSLISSMLISKINEEGELIVCTNRFFKITKSKKIKIILDISYFTDFVYEGNNQLSFVFGKQFIQSIDSVITKTYLPFDKNYVNTSKFKNKFVFFHKLNSTIWAFDKEKQLRKRYENLNKPSTIKFSSQDIWLIYTSSGVDILDSNYRLVNKKGRLFPNKLISSFLEDKEGNILLGTFNNGIIFIPNRNTQTIPIPDDLKLTQITSDNNGNLFLGNSYGSIYKLDSSETLSVFAKNTKKNIEILEYFPKKNEILTNYNDRNIFINVEKNQKKIFIPGGALKDIESINSSQYLLATNSMIEFYNPENTVHDFPLITAKLKSGYIRKKLTHYSGRHYCVNYDSKNKYIYAGSASGLKIGKYDEAPSYFKLENNDVLATDIRVHNDKVYISTQKDGVLIFKKNKLIDQWNIRSEFISNYVSKIVEKNNQLYILTNKGLAITSTDGDILHLINDSEGLNTNNIFDFEIMKDFIYLLNQKGIQKIALKKLSPFSYSPQLFIKSIKVNNFSILDKTEFDHKYNKFLFKLGTNSYKYKKEISYLHRLLPIEKKWLDTPYDKNSIEYKSLPPGSYTFEAKTSFRNEQSSIVSYSFTIDSPYWQKWWFFLLIIVFSIVITILILYYKSKKKIKEVQLQSELNLSKLTAIQSQMNPHFIFNALNSIQHLILKGDVDNSYRYITNFANLVRKTLNFSDKEFISFENEIKLLQLYLQIEKLRFKEHFNYFIDTNGIENISVPPLLAQPFVENALIHGLLHKEGNKELNISFELQDELVCTIQDNGIGREKAAEIKKRQNRTNESFSVNAIRKRFEILKKMFGGKLGVQYIDIVENEKNIGTKVILRIPYNHSS